MKRIAISVLFVPTLFVGAAFGQRSPGSERLTQAYQDRLLTESTSSLKTDEHISMYETLIKAQPEVLHYQNLLAGAYIQKVRESMDYAYLCRSSLEMSPVSPH